MPVINATSQALSVTGNNVAAPVLSAWSQALSVVTQSTTSMHSSVWTGGLSITAYPVFAFFRPEGDASNRKRKVRVLAEPRLIVTPFHGSR